MTSRDRQMIDAVSALEDDEDDEDFASIAPPRRPTQVYSVRIPVHRVEQLRRLAKEMGKAPTQLMREWVTERLDSESTAPPKADATIHASPVVNLHPPKEFDIREIERLGRVSA